MDNFEENNNLFDFHGTINRRNFMVNILLVETLKQAFVVTPLLIILFLNTDLLKKLYTEAVMPEWWYVIEAFTALLCTFLYMPSIIKRVRDVFGEERQDKVFSYSLCTFIILLVGVVASVSSNIVFLIVKCLGIGIILSLMMMQGTVSGAKPKSEVARFNWGAFIATWFWGLFNRSYKTLWALPLFFTTGFFPFALICGMKGNEWAYEKKEDKNIDLFHFEQRKQSVIWLVAIPIVACIMSIVAAYSFTALISSYSKTHPQFLSKTEDFYIEVQAQNAQTKFDKIELTKNEYKFYIAPKIWTKTSTNEKSALFDMASSYAMSKNPDIKKNDKKAVLKVWNKTKIYSSFNDEKLMEFNVPEKTITNLVDNLKQNLQNQQLLLKEIQNGYKINSYPSVP